MNMAGPATADATTTRQRRDRSRPSGTSRAGRVMPRAMAGAQNVTSVGHGLQLGGQGKGTLVADELVDPGPQRDDQAPGERRGRKQPTDRVGRPPQGQHQPDGPVPEREAHGEQGAVSRTVAVSGRATASATASPAAQQPMVASQSAQAATVLAR